MKITPLAWTCIITAAAMLLTGCTITGKSSTAMYGELVDCSLNTDIEILEFDGIQQACYRENSIYFIADNTGTTKITGMNIYLESDYNLNMKVKTIMDPGDTKEQTLHFGTQELTGVKTLTIRPMITIDGEQVTCSDAGIQLLLTRC
ncbi:hypothetical protein KY362_08425 [Candidatus Woesearchaeota archaeon]|nr:hypothetical protein [Candidatus Woesearchaeota archaeon]